MKSILILGSGYTGSFLETTASAEHRFTRTRRAASHGVLAFDLSNEATWSSLEFETYEGSFWTFPAEPLAGVKKFLDQYQSRLGRIVAIGSTGNYLVKVEAEEVREDSELDLSESRVQGELEILSRGGIVVRAAGIYGPKRLPTAWVEKALVGPSDRLVNFVHLSDLSQILWAAMLKGRLGATYLAADGQPQRWRDLIEVWTKKFAIKIPASAKISDKLSKRIRPEASLRELGIRLQYKDVNAGLDSELGAK